MWEQRLACCALAAGFALVAGCSAPTRVGDSPNTAPLSLVPPLRANGMLARHAREARPQARQRSRAPRRSCKPRHVLLVVLPTSLAGLVGLWHYTSIAQRRPATTTLPAAAVPLPAVVPFVVLFESSSGSSWLMQELGALPEVCAIGFEPIDNISMASVADHTLRLRWLRTLWTPQRGSASEWVDWQAALQRASVFGQDDAIRRSLGGCRRTDAVAYGLKARLSRLLSDEPSVARVAALMVEQGVRVVRLSRRNVIKQALAEYRRLHAGLGQFRRRGANASISSIEVELRLFKRALQARWLSPRTSMHAQRCCTHISYMMWSCAFLLARFMPACCDCTLRLCMSFRRYPAHVALPRACSPTLPTSHCSRSRMRRCSGSTQRRCAGSPLSSVCPRRPPLPR